MLRSTSELFDSLQSHIIPRETSSDFDCSALTKRIQLMESEGIKQKEKPILMVMSDDRNCREMGIITHTTYKLQQALGFENTPEILTAAGQNSLITLSRNVLWHLQKYANQYSAIVTLDPWVTHLVHNVTKDQPETAPLVFVGLNQTMINTVLGRTDSPMENTTGIRTLYPEYHEQIEVLRDLRPTGSRIILPYVDISNNEPDIKDLFSRDYTDLTDICVAKDFNVNTVRVTPKDSVVDKLKQMDVRKGDIVCISAESAILSHAEEITDLCNEKNATAYAFDLTAVARGAAMGSGSSGYTYACQLSSILYQMIGDKRRPGEVPVVTIVENTESRYNEMAFRKQGVEPTNRDWRLMKIRSIFAYDEE